MHVVIDIETRRDTPFMSRGDVEDVLREGTRAHGGCKTQEAVAKSKEEKWVKMVEGSAKSPLTGKIVAIGVGNLHDDVPPIVIADEDSEADLLERFAVWIEMQRSFMVWCGWRVRTFDIPFITVRAAVCGVEMPGGWPTRRWDNRVFDLSETLDPEYKTDLNTWLVRCGLPLKTANGKDVEHMTGDEVAEYCANDVVRERLLLRKFAKAVPMLRPRTPEEVEEAYP